VASTQAQKGFWIRLSCAPYVATFASTGQVYISNSLLIRDGTVTRLLARGA